MLVNMSMIPLKGIGSFSLEVAKVIEIIDASGLAYKMHPMGTVIEGSWDDVMGLIKKCHAKLRETSPRVLTTVTIDDREGAEGRIDGKVASVEAKLGKKVKK